MYYIYKDNVLYIKTIYEPPKVLQGLPQSLPKLPQSLPKALQEVPQTLPKLLKELPEPTQRPAGPPERPGAVPGGGFTGQVAQSDGRVFKNEGLGILRRIRRIPRIPRILLKWCQQVRPRPYLPHAPGARMT